MLQHSLTQQLLERKALGAARGRAKEEIAALPAVLRSTLVGQALRKLVASDGLVREIERLVAEAK